MVDIGYYKNASPEFYKLRTITQRKEGNDVLGISLPPEKVKRFKDTYFKVEVIGTMILLESGCVPTRKHG